MNSKSDSTNTTHQVHAERHSGRRYALSIFLILTIWQVLGSLPYAFLYIAGLAQDVVINYLAISFSFVAFIAAIIGCVKWNHRRNWLGLIGPDLRVDWRRLSISFGLWMALMMISTLLDALVHPGLYRLTFHWPSWLAFSLLALVLTPIQTSAEELFFRGFLLQGIQRLVKNRWVLVVISGVIFALPHFGNPEMQLDFWLLASFYFGFGAFLAYLTLHDGRLEAALGIHAANNLFTVVFANYDGSALPSPSIFTSAGMDPVFNLIVLLVSVVIFMIVYRFTDKTYIKSEA